MILVSDVEGTTRTQCLRVSLFLGSAQGGQTGASRQCAHGTIRSSRLYRTGNPTHVRPALVSFSSLHLLVEVWGTRKMRSATRRVVEVGLEVNPDNIELGPQATNFHKKK